MLSGSLRSAQVATNLNPIHQSQALVNKQNNITRKTQRFTAVANASSNDSKRAAYQTDAVKGNLWSNGVLSHSRVQPRTIQPEIDTHVGTNNALFHVDPTDMCKTVRAVILAGGETENPLTKYRAMPAVSLGSSSLCIIDVPINNCLKAGINKIYVVTQYQSAILNSHVAAYYPPVRFGGPDQEGYVDILAAQQTVNTSEWYKGSADALRKNMNELKDEARGITPATDYIILSGTGISNLDLERMVAIHRARGADITMALHAVSAEQAVSKGIASAHRSSGKILKFEERPHPESLASMRLDLDQALPGKEFLASMGVYVFRREALFRLLDPNKSNAITHIGHHVIPNALAQEFKVYGYRQMQLNGDDVYWRDVSTLREYYETQMELTLQDAPVQMHDVAFALSAAGKDTQAPPARALGTSTVECSLLNDGAVLVDSTVRNSVIGECVYVGRNSVIERSVILRNPQWMNEEMKRQYVAAGERIYGVGDNCHLKGCILDENVTLGDNVKILNAEGVKESDRAKSDGFMIQDGLVVVLRNAVIPAGTVI